MKINLTFPRNDTCKQFEVDDERLRKSSLYEQRLGQQVEGKVFSDEWDGYILKITGGSDKDGFPMAQGVLAASRVLLFLKRGAIGYNAWRGRSGERRRKSVRGCILGADIAVLNLIIVKPGTNEIAGVTDVQNPRRLGPKRASKIRKLFGLSKDEDVRRFVVRRKVEKEGKKPRMKAPKIQRLITPTIRARRAAKVNQHKVLLQKSQEQRREFLELLTTRRMASRQRNNAHLHRHKMVEQKQLAAALAKAPGGAKKVAKK
jgi:small subunit ribosomal protein S6e